MKNWKRIFVICLLAVCAISALPRTVSFARSLSAFSRLKMAGGDSLGKHSTGNRRLDGYITQSARKHRVDPVLMFALIHQESGGKINAVSCKGARGLTQLMPGTARSLGVKNIRDPRQNIEGGTKYIRILLNMFKGNLALALAGYNAGQGAVIKYGYRVPPYRETQNYVISIGSNYSRLRPKALARGR